MKDNIKAINKNSIELAIKLLKDCKVICFPTETVYGIGCDLNNKNGVQKIELLKKRKNQAFQILCANKQQILNFGIDLNNTELEIIDKLMPGEITLLVKRTGRDFDYFLFDSEFIGFRIPNNQSILKIIEQNGPIIASSANFKNESSAKSSNEVFSYFGNKIELILDGGILEKSIGSSVLYIENGKPIFLRKGDNIDKIESVLNNIL